MPCPDCLANASDTDRPAGEPTLERLIARLNRLTCDNARLGECCKQLQQRVGQLLGETEVLTRTNRELARTNLHLTARLGAAGAMN